jgi:hypothetical protein
MESAETEGAEAEGTEGAEDLYTEGAEVIGVRARSGAEGTEAKVVSVPAAFRATCVSEPSCCGAT